MLDSTPSLIDVYIDDSQVDIQSRRCLVYASVIPRNLEESIRRLAAIKTQFGLPVHTEVKWALPSLEATAKAALKDRVLECLVRDFQCLVAITEGDNKNLAFVNALRQIAAFMKATGYSYASIYCDVGSVQSKAVVDRELKAWNGIACTGFGVLDSQFAVGIQFADMLAGAFQYMVRATFEGRSRMTRYYDEGYEQEIELPLDHYFRLLLRHSFWGDVPEYTEQLADADFMAAMSANCLGKGITLHGAFADNEIAVIQELATFYRGCMH